MKKILKIVLNYFSVIIFHLIPKEFRKEVSKSKLQKKIENHLTEETYKNFLIHFKKSLLFKLLKSVRHCCAFSLRCWRDCSANNIKNNPA